MKRDEYLNEAPFAVPQTEKDAFFTKEMNRLTAHHRGKCDAYDAICRGIGGDSTEPGKSDALGESLCGFNRDEGPYLPVTLFKDLELRSVAGEDVVRQITSSGTSGQKPSRIFLDAETSMAQQQTLCSITGDFIGGSRIPMLIIDSPDVLRDRKKFTARGAGILGFSIMSSRRYYALDSEMNLDWESIDAFIAKAGDEPSFAFGFTYMVWVYFCEAVRKSGKKLELGDCHLIHGGGWKKLQSSSVSDAEFKAGLKEYCGITGVSNYYGMAEQTGSIFMECEAGHLHASRFSDIEILNPLDFSEQETGEWGLIALKSYLPTSYPGHKILTEDWGRVTGIDNCSCGRKGKCFEISGRIKKAEIRGCSDTFEKNRGTPSENSKLLGEKNTYANGNSNCAADSNTNCDNDGPVVKAGSWPVSNDVDECFSTIALKFIKALSELFTRTPEYRAVPEIYAFGFWCRESHVLKLKRRHEEVNGAGRKGRGLVLHVAPSNMPTMFAYSWVTSLLAGNSNVVRISGRDAEITDMLIGGIDEVLKHEEFEIIKARNAFIQFPRDHSLLRELSEKASARIIWGGDSTVERIRSVDAAEDCTDIAFPDKYSIAVLNESFIGECTDEELRRIAHLFYNDTYGADQNACSSPRFLFWIDGYKPAEELGDSATAASELSESKKDSYRKSALRFKEIRRRWWDALADEAEKYDLQPWMATEKYRNLCCTYAKFNGQNEIGTVSTWTNRLYVLPVNRINAPLWEYEAKMGMFYEYDLMDYDELMPHLGEKVQTVVTIGVDSDKLQDRIRESGCPGVDRVVSVGEALEFDTVWDRKDMIRILSDQV